ncbi:hypothetical protein SAMN02910297_00786 [Methanobrevibacter olleyae]|uniref:Uncharacterized protein n=1 Tax=Methanobrevibacter olleyae TaxID=294671 RepID=A0A1I4HEU2_METOL|nr:hypothetical protein [Methanobrevibacter olleyae]SFL40031.1 hypothetical protein SAMN02910297_00786 [Methanobrevibacter olleyae]
MDGKLDIDSFEKAINGLNKNLNDVGLLFRANMPLLATDATQETKENCVDKMSDRISDLLDSFRESYSYYNGFYEKLKENVRNETIESPEEYEVFFSHANETFPKYIDELGQSIDSLCDIDVKTEKFNITMRELGSIIENFRFDFKRTLAIADLYQIQKESKEN